MIRIVIIVTLWFIFFITLLSIIYIVFKGIGKVKFFLSSFKNKWIKNKQLRKRKQKEKKLPPYIRERLAEYDEKIALLSELDKKWQLKIVSIIALATKIHHSVLDNPSLNESLRTYFSVSLPALCQLIDTLHAEKRALSEHERNKVKANLLLLESDFKAYLEQLELKEKRRFDTVMEVIKRRVKNR